jgi:acetyl esterase/lipase
MTHASRIASSIMLTTAVVARCFGAAAQAETPGTHPCPSLSIQLPPRPDGSGPGPQLHLRQATTIAPSDTSTSTVIHPDPKDQIVCGRAPLKSISNVVFATRTLPDGKSIELSMDLLVPQSARHRPLVVYITGGGFVMAPKESELKLRTYVAEAGFAVASIQYRTVVHGATYKDGVADVKSAIRYLRANAGKYGIDAGKIAVWGESAGGYLGPMVGLTNGIKTFDVGNDLDQSSDVQAVIDDFGPSDIEKIGADFDPATRAMYSDPNNPVLHYVPPGLAAANPLSYVTASAPPFLIFHGSQDRLVSPSQTLLLHNALVAAGASSTRYVLDGANHGDLAFMGDLNAGLPWSTNQTMKIILEFLKRTIG